MATPLGRSTVWIAGQSPQTLVKHPNEQRLFAFDFTQVFAGDALQSLGQTFGQGLTLPLLFSLVPQSIINLEVHRLDWQTLDLTLGTAKLVGNQFQFVVSSGSDGTVYQFTCKAQTSLGNIVVGVGLLKVTVKIP